MSRDHSHKTAGSSGSSNVIPFPRQESRHGTVYIYPCAMNGGGWAVAHQSRYGDSDVILGSFIGLNEAIANARYWAERLGAGFDDGSAA